MNSDACVARNDTIQERVRSCFIFASNVIHFNTIFLLVGRAFIRFPCIWCIPGFTVWFSYNYTNRVHIY